jgi:hypothetical protein
MQLDRVTAVFTGGRQDVRELLTEHLGQPLTPEIAASIELAARPSRYVEKISEMVAVVVDHPQPDLPITHTFPDKLYCRQMDIPAGMYVVGAMHRIENVVVISKGRIVVATPDGPMTLVAGDTLVCRPGTQNVVCTQEDSRWTNVFPNPLNLRDPDELTEMVSLMKASEIMGGADNIQILLSGKATQEVLP